MSYDKTVKEGRPGSALTLYHGKRFENINRGLFGVRGLGNGASDHKMVCASPDRFLRGFDTLLIPFGTSRRPDTGCND